VKIYLAGPVDNCNKSEQTVWRHMVKQVYPHFIHMDPMEYEMDYVRGKKNMGEVIEAEKHDIYNCDVLLAYPWKSSSGTAMEIMYAYMLNMDLRRNNKIKVVIVIEKDKYLSPWIQHHADVVVKDFHGAFEWIEKQVDASSC
jgi:nucleoside 2-deoxyribosyltransferase